MKIDSILIIGCGGLGGFVIEETARLGIKNLTLMDGDVFCESNMNRQLESGLDTLGKSKAVVYKERLERKFNAKVNAITEFFSESNSDILKSVDVVIECVDSISARLLIEKECEKYNKILIHGGVDYSYGQVCVCFPGEKKLAKFYKTSREKRHTTNAYSVATVASMQVALLNRLMLDEVEEWRHKLVVVDLESLTIDVLGI